MIERCFKPIEIWRGYANDVDGRAMPCGHCIPEEQPELPGAELESFLGA